MTDPNSLPRRKRRPRIPKDLSVANLRADLLGHCYLYLREVAIERREAAMVKAISEVVLAHGRDFEANRRVMVQIHGPLPFDVPSGPSPYEAIDSPGAPIR